MAEDLPVVFPPDFSGKLTETRSKLLAETRELEAMGVKVTRIVVQADDGPPRFYIEFASDKPQWTVRAELEKQLYDIGQTIGANELSFYATRRIEKTKGWAT